MEQQQTKQEPSFGDVYHVIDGLPLCRAFQEEKVRSAFSYYPEDGDLFIATYPKCGTTWMGNIVYSILTKGYKNLPSATELKDTMPMMERVGAEAVSSLKQPRVMKTHVPLKLLNFSPKAKYIYVARNPYDCCVSFYYHTKGIPFYYFDKGTFDQFLEMFVKGEVAYGEYFAHLLGWYEHRKDENVLFLTYEDLKMDTRGWILKVADFLGIQSYGDLLRENPAMLDKVLELTTFQKAQSTRSGDKMFTNESARATGDGQQSGNSTILLDVEAVVKRAIENNSRKGIVGDWKNHFSAEQVSKMQEYISLKACGSDVMGLWGDYDLPYCTNIY